jgi:tetratricopeptide (TPR) repeat protein
VKIFFLSLIFLSADAAWGRDAALDLYYQGARYESARNYQQAAALYRQAIPLTNTAFAAVLFRQAGNCGYYLGLTSQAVADYEKYLAFYPRDAKVAKIVAYYKMPRQALPAATPVPQAQPIQQARPATATAAAFQTPTIVTPSDELSIWSATWRSVLMPGFGQSYRNDWWGVAYFAGSLGCGGAAFFLRKTADDRYSNYLRAGTVTDARDLYEQTANLDQMSNQFISAAIGVYAANVLDAILVTWVEVSLKNKAKTADLGVHFVLRPDLQPALQLDWRI